MKHSYINIMLRLIKLVKPLTFYMIIAIVMGVIGHLCATFITILGGYAILNVLNIETYLNITSIFVIIILCAIFRGFLRYAEQSCNHFIAFKILALIRDHVFLALRRLCPAKLDGKDKGNLISLITSDIELLEVFYAHTISPIVIALIFSTIMTIFISSYHIVLGFIACLSYITIGIFIPIVISKSSGDIGIKFRTHAGELSSYVLDSLRGLDETIQYNDGLKRLDTIQEYTHKLSLYEKTTKYIQAYNNAMSNTMIFIFDISMLFVSSMLLGFEGCLIVTLALMSSYGPVVALAALGSTLQNTMACATRVLDILDETPIVEDIKDRQDISFDCASVNNITFAYDNEMILDDCSLDISSNSIIGIHGQSGSGKSTLLKLLMRFYQSQKGSIHISSTNIENINTSNLRDIQSYVTQETHLFHDSILNNLKIAKLDATDEEIISACKKASIHDFIMSLQHGYNTKVGELGESLSGGERQRIGLARAFLHNAPFMLLDEPTSNLDSLNEAVILKSLCNERDNKTVVLVSHRKSTMGITDKTYCINNQRMS